MEGVSNLKITIANTVDHRLMVWGGRAIENFKIANTAANANMGLIISINPKDNRRTSFTKL